MTIGITGDRIHDLSGKAIDTSLGTFSWGVYEGFVGAEGTGASTDTMDLDAWSRPAEDRTVIFWVNMHELSDYLFDTASGRLVLGWDGANFGLYDGAWKYVDTSPPLNELVCVSFVLDGTNNVSSFYLNGEPNGTDTCTSKAIGDTTALWSYSSGISKHLNGYAYEAIFYNRVLSAKENRQFYQLGPGGSLQRRDLILPYSTGVAPAGIIPQAMHYKKLMRA
jgi:hypothetical protein